MSIIRIEELIREEISNESNLYDFFKSRKASLPDGSMEIRNTAYGKYYFQKVRVNGLQTSVCLDPHNDFHRQIIRELMEKKTITHALPILKKNINAMERCIERIEPYHPSNYMFGNYLGSEFYLPDDVCLKDWIKKPENANPYRPEDRIHDTKRGILVRSKSEALISDILFDADVLYKNEPALEIGGRVIYPDIELIHPYTHRLLWWDHLGKIDDPVYIDDKFDRLLDYSRNGIILGVNLILTWETRTRPLTRRMVEQRLREFGLI